MKSYLRAFSQPPKLNKIPSLAGATPAPLRHLSGFFYFFLLFLFFPFSGYPQSPAAGHHLPSCSLHQQVWAAILLRHTFKAAGLLGGVLPPPLHQKWKIALLGHALPPLFLNHPKKTESSRGRVYSIIFLLYGTCTCITYTCNMVKS